MLFLCYYLLFKNNGNKRRCALLDKPARSAYNKNAKEIAFMEFMKANKKPFGIASTCVGLVLAVHKELFVKPLADIVRYDTCCDGQYERNYRIHRVHLLPSGGAGGTAITGYHRFRRLTRSPTTLQYRGASFILFYNVRITAQ